MLSWLSCTAFQPLLSYLPHRDHTMAEQLCVTPADYMQLFLLQEIKHFLFHEDGYSTQEF